MNRLLPAAALLLATVLVPLPAYAADVTCSVEGNSVTVTFTGGGAHWLGHSLGGSLSVDKDGLQPLDCEGSDVGTADKVIAVSAGGTSQWTFDVAMDWTAQVSIANGTQDTLLVQGYELSEYWVATSTLELVIGQDQATTLTLDDTPAGTTFDTADGDDFLNLTAWAGPTSFQPGEGSDELIGSSGADSVSVLPDEGDDILAGGAGIDSLSLSEAEDDVFYSANDEADDGAADEADDYSGFENVTGGQGNDRLVADPDGAVLHGGPGNDRLVGGAGNDQLHGDSGFDTVSFEAGAAVTVLGGAVTGQGTDTIDVPVEGLHGSPAADAITVDNGGAEVRPGHGNDALVATVAGVHLVAEPTSDGNDTFVAPDGTWDYHLRTSRVTVTLGAGSPDEVSPGEFDDVDLHSVIGGRGNDILLGSEQADVLHGSLGQDTVNGHGGDDQVRGGAGDDLVGGGLGDDLVFGDDGNDQVLGGEHDDLLRGGTGNDFLSGGPQNDTVYGDAGNDTLDEGTLVSGADALYGGIGFDKARYALRNTLLRLSNDGVANDGGSGELDSIGPDVEWLVGGKKDDVIKGGPGAERLQGGKGADTLNGWNGNDLLVGGSGEDELRGGAGKDRLHSKDTARDLVYGGKGRDRARPDFRDLVAQVEGRF